MRGKYRYVSIILAILIFVYTCVGEGVWLASDAISNHFIRYCIAKLILFCFIFLWITIVLKMLQAWKKETTYKNIVIYYVSIVLLCTMSQMLVYPGCWGNDTTTILDFTRNLEYLTYQHYLSTFFYFIGASLFPFNNEFGIVFIQVNIIALILSYIFNECNFFDYKLGKYSLLLLLPSMMYCFLFPIRCIWLGCAFALLMLLFYKVHCDWEERGYIRKRLIWCASPIVIFATIIRSESIYILFVWLLYCLYWCIKLKFKDVVTLITNMLICIVLVVLFSIPQKYDNEYKTTAFLTPLSTLMSDERLRCSDEEFKAIDKIIDVEALKRNASYTSMEIAFAEGEKDAWNRNFTEKEWKEFLTSYVKIVVKNFDIFLKYRFKTFWATSGLDRGWRAYGMPIQDRNLIGYKLMVYGLEEDGNIFYKLYYSIAWNTILPSMILIIGLLYSLITKKWWCCIMLLIGIGELVLIFLTVTSSQYMFHFPFVIAGYIALLIMLSESKRLKRLRV